MGFDIIGCRPSSEVGKYFCNNVWNWRPLAHYCYEIAPDITKHCREWHTNDGDGLDADQALALAARLDAEVRAGCTEQHARRHESVREMMPTKPCWLCGGTGTRKPPSGRGIAEASDALDFDSNGEIVIRGNLIDKNCPIGPGDMKTGVKCNACRGEGFTRPFAAHYPFTVENVRNFVAFLRECGGFQIG